MAKEQSLESKVKTYWTNRDKNSATGLALLDQCINRFAAHGDWDHLARFYVAALRVNQGPAIKRVIRAAFGDSVKFSLDSKHDTGGKFTKVNWPDAVFPLHESNTYGIVTSAVGQGKGWDNKEFQKSLAEALPSVKKERKVTDEAKKKVVKHLKTYTDKLAADGFVVGEILAMLQKELAASVATSGKGVEKKVVNGATVFEPQF